MLAYVFWHWPQGDVPPDEYESSLIAFHERLRQSPSPGFRRSSTRRVEGAPWLPAGPAYEDWYLLDNTGALDALGAGVTSTPVDERHAPIAALAEGGAAGLYKPAIVAEHSGNGSTAHWFTKPARLSYAALYAALDHLEAGAGAGLWMRMFTLGPTPEFCLLRNRPLTLPSGWRPIAVRRQVVWNPIQRS
jgi:hypothetical protein